MNKPKVLFIYDLADETNWKDGLWAAIELLKKDFIVEKVNIAKGPIKPYPKDFDFVLGWGGFSSEVDKVLRTLQYHEVKKGLCLGGYGFSPLAGVNDYNVIFYECDWAKVWLESHRVITNLVHAFGVNTDIYKPNPAAVKIWDYITVGTFSNWKRQTLLLGLEGRKIAVGTIQPNNLSESIDIVGNLLLGHCTVSDEVSPETLAKLYNASKECYMPADILGGGERAVLEARACGIPVSVEDDNSKLQELIVSPVWDHFYYAKQLKEGILKCI